MKQLSHHLPVILLVFLIVMLGVTDWAIGVDYRVGMTLLAPTLWVGLYLLGSNRAQES